MDISALTQQAATNGKGPVTGQVPASAGMFGTVAGASFMDLIFAHLAADTKIPSSGLIQNGLQNSELIASQPDYDGHTEPLTTQQILQAILETDPAALEEMASELPEGVTPESLINAQTNAQASLEVPLSPSPKKLMDFLESLVAGLPQENKPIVLDIAPGQIKKIFGRIQIEVGENGEATSPALIATGLTPEKLTAILEDIVDGNEQGEGIIIGMIKILPPQAKKEAIFLPRGLVIVQPQHPAGEISTPQAMAEAENNTLMKANSLTSDTTGFPLEEDDFEGVLRVLERAQNKALERGQNNPGLEKAINTIKQISAGLSTVQGAPPTLGAIFTSFVLDSIYPEGLDFAGAPGQSMNLTGPAQFASLIGQAQHAGLPHPATQVIASTITKAATNGEAKNITIQLDPPALGKVRISLDFNNESQTMKALLVAEKPETFLMLQRDAQILERALLDAGLDVDSGGLSFELSQDGNLFDDDNKGQGGSSGDGNNGEGSEAAADENIEIIETTMDWYADPNTGLMRYDALV